MDRKAINLVLDWDGTLTRKDTMFAMAEIVAAKDRRLRIDSDAEDRWTGFGNAYMEDYKAHEAQYRPVAHDRRIAAEESAWLRSLASVERQSVDRVERSKYFKGVTQDDIDGASQDLHTAEKVVLRPGWDELIMDVSHEHDVVGVLSVNWSATFIRAALLQAADHVESGTPGELEERNLVNRVKAMDIRANDIVGIDNPEGSDGRLTTDGQPGIRMSHDKLQHLDLLPEHMNIYVGDSATDFDCLTAVDLGICIRDEPSGSSQKVLADTLSRLGREVKHISSVSPSDVQPGKSNALAWARDFYEIVKFIYTLE